MKNKFSLFEQLEDNIKTIEEIDDSVKITLGPTGKNGISLNKKGNLIFLTSGSLLLKAFLILLSIPSSFNKFTNSIK